VFRKVPTPFSLTFGREARLPIDVMFGPPPGEELTSSSQYAFLLRQHLESAYHRVRTQLALHQCRQKTLYDRKAAGHSYSVGDHVWLHCPAVTRGNSRKLHCPWQGPYKIVIADVLYQLQLVKQPWRCIVVHYNRLEPYQGHRNGHGLESPPVPIQPSNNQPSPESDYNYDDEPLVILRSQPDTQTANDPPLRRSSRQRKPPDRYGDRVSY